MFKNILVALGVVALSFSAQAAGKTKEKAPAAKEAPAATTASNSQWFFKPYAGADYQYTQYGNENVGAGLSSDDILDTGLHGANVHVGARVHKNLGVELGVFQTQQGSKTSATLGKTKADVQGVTLDVLGYYPVAPKTELIGTVGVSYSEATFKNATTGKDTEEEFNARVGAGAQYWLNDKVNVRGLVRYEGADFDGAVDNAFVYTAGVNYQF